MGWLLSGATAGTKTTLAFIQSAARTITFPDATGTVVLKDTVDVMTNKRHTPRVYSTTSLATLTPEISTYDVFVLTAQAEALDIANHATSTPTVGELLEVVITPDATPRDLTYGTNYIAKSGVALPSTTVASKRMRLLFEWGTDSKFDLLAVGNEA
jgi:hypothetical protein